MLLVELSVDVSFFMMNPLDRLFRINALGATGHEEEVKPGKAWFRVKIYPRNYPRQHERGLFVQSHPEAYQLVMFQLQMMDQHVSFRFYVRLFFGFVLFSRCRRMLIQKLAHSF